MCNEYQVRMDFGSGDWWRAVEAEITLHWDGLPSNRPINQPFKPTNRAPMLRPIDPANPRAGLTGYDARWWMVPFFHKGKLAAWKNMCTNAKIETVDTLPAYREPYKRRRALIPITRSSNTTSRPAGRRASPSGAGK